MSLASMYSRKHSAGIAGAEDSSRRRSRTARAVFAAALLAIACTLSTLAVAVAGASAASTLAWGSVSEVEPPAGVPSGQKRVELAEVSCTAPGDCSAVGTVEPKGEEVQALALDETNGVWGEAALVEVPEASEVIASDLLSVSCSAAGECAAAGYDETKAKLRQAIVASETGGHWAPAQVVQEPATSARAMLMSVACTGPGSCVAVGESENASKHMEAVAVAETGGTWATAVAVPLPADAGPEGGSLESVSCPAASECAATGWYYSESSHSYDAVGANDVEGTWKSEGIAIPNDVSGPFTSLHVSCSAVGSCGLSGYYYETFPTSRAITASYAEEKWSASVQSIDSPGGDENTYLYTLSCPASGSCVSVGGFYSPTEEESEPLVASETAGVWAGAGTVALPSNALTEEEAKTLGGERYGGLYSVSCWAVGECEAVGEYEQQTGAYAPMAASETGGVWDAAEEVAPPSNAMTNSEGEAWLEDLSCTAGGRCGAVGAYKESPGEFRGMTASAGSALSVTSSSLPAGQVGVPYSAQLAATGGLGSYSWSVVAGSLPAGLTLDAATGAISGTPTGAGTSFTVSVANAGPPALTAQRPLSIAIAPVAPKPVGKPIAKPTIAIVGAKLKAAKNRVQVTLACGGAACRGVVKLVAVTKVRVRRKGKTVMLKRSVVVASGAYEIAAGRTQAVAIKLTAKGRRLLAKLAKHRSLGVKLIVTVDGGVAASKTVKLS